jgi:hypothetical protein
MTVRGKIVRDETGNLSLQSLPNQSFALAENDLSRSLTRFAGSTTEVTVRGQLYKKTSEKKKASALSPMKLVVLGIEKQE